MLALFLEFAKLVGIEVEILDFQLFDHLNTMIFFEFLVIQLLLDRFFFLLLKFPLLLFLLPLLLLQYLHLLLL